MNKDILVAIEDACELGLNSHDPLHWEATLADILTVVRLELTKGGSTIKTAYEN